MKAVDSSVAIQAVAGWHESHELCRIATTKGVDPEPGGSACDAFIGSIASDNDATLLTLNRRALRTDERLGIEVELIST